MPPSARSASWAAPFPRSAAASPRPAVPPARASAEAPIPGIRPAASKFPAASSRRFPAEMAPTRSAPLPATAISARASAMFRLPAAPFSRRGIVGPPSAAVRSRHRQTTTPLPSPAARYSRTRLPSRPMRGAAGMNVPTRSISTSAAPIRLWMPRSSSETAAAPSNTA